MLGVKEKKFVEAIEEGRIVRVPEEYAKREGLLILRKRGGSLKGINVGGESLSANEVREGIKLGEKSAPKAKKGVLDFEELRKPLNWRKNQIVKELIDNFHWHISKARKNKGVSRKKLAEEVGIKEEELKMLENGIIPENDFVFINKIQDYLGINLRKDGKDFQKSARFEVESEKKIKEELEKEEEKTLSEEIGTEDSIELDEEEDKEVLGEEIEIIDS